MVNGVTPPIADDAAPPVGLDGAPESVGNVDVAGSTALCVLARIKKGKAQGKY